MMHLQALSGCSQGTAWSSRSRLASAPIRSGRISRTLTRSLPEQGEDISEAMKADLERLRAKSAAGAGASSGAASPNGAAQQSGAQGSGFKDTLDKILIADFFLVLLILAWLAAGVAQNALSGGAGSPLLDAWYPLWPLLWQPALGVLMAGALMSGGLGWLREQAAKKE